MQVGATEVSFDVIQTESLESVRCHWRQISSVEIPAGLSARYLTWLCVVTPSSKQDCRTPEIYSSTASKIPSGKVSCYPIESQCFRGSGVLLG